MCEQTFSHCRGRNKKGLHAQKTQALEITTATKHKTEFHIHTYI